MSKFVINQEDFLRGAAENDFQNNGGYSPEDKSGNIYVKKGVLAPPPLVTENSGAVESIAGWCTKWSALGAPIRAFGIDSGADGHFYTVTAAGVVAEVSEDTGHDYHAKKSDILYFPFNGQESILVSSTTDVAQFSEDMASANYDWWAVDRSAGALGANNVHQMINYGASGGELAFITNGTKIASWNGTTATAAAFTMPDGWTITAIVEYRNKIYIAAETSALNFSGSNHVKSAIFIWDGLDTTDYEDVHYLNDRIDCMYVFQGMLLIFTSRYMAYWNGLNFTHLHDLDHQVFKYMITQFRDRLYIVQSKAILVYDGQRFSYLLVLENNINALFSSSDVSLLLHSNGKISLSYFENADSNGTAKVGTGYWRSRRSFFDQNVIIKKITVELAEPLASGSVMNIMVLDHNGTSTTVGSMTHAADGAIRSKEINNINLNMTSMQVRIHWSAVAKQVARIAVEYEPTKKPI